MCVLFCICTFTFLPTGYSLSLRVALVFVPCAMRSGVVLLNFRKNTHFFVSLAGRLLTRNPWSKFYILSFLVFDSVFRRGGGVPPLPPKNTPKTSKSPCSGLPPFSPFHSAPRLYGDGSFPYLFYRGGPGRRPLPRDPPTGGPTFSDSESRGGHFDPLFDPLSRPLIFHYFL